ncbi:hypothetical protein CHS0354_008107, partial [Potamilus streckersoni]
KREKIWKEIGEVNEYNETETWNEIGELKVDTTRKNGGTPQGKTLSIKSFFCLQEMKSCCPHPAPYHDKTTTLPTIRYQYSTTHINRFLPSFIHICIQPDPRKHSSDKSWVALKSNHNWQAAE